MGGGPPLAHRRPTARTPGGEEEKMNHPHTAEPAVTTIARLNDKFRSTVEGGEVLMTAAVNALPVDVRAAHRCTTGVDCLHEGQ